MTVDARVAVTVDAKKVAVKIARDVMAPGQNPEARRVMEPVKAVARVAVADAVVAVAGVAPGGIGEIAQCKTRVSGASVLMLKASQLRWILLPHLR